MAKTCNNDLLLLLQATKRIELAIILVYSVDILLKKKPYAGCA